VSSLDDPRQSGRAPVDGAPELVRVSHAHGTSRAALLAVAAALLIGVAVWKPWEDGRPATRGPIGALPDASSVLIPAATSGPAARLAPVGSPAPTIAGLNLAVMGTADPHPAWGVAVAYVPRNQIDAAVLRGSPTVTPVVDWELIEPGRAAPGPVLDHPGVVSVAIAATWPPGARPLAIHLRSSPFPVASPSPRHGPAGEVALPPPLATWIETLSGETPGAGLGSGAFYLPAEKPPSDPEGWTGRGWPPGVYTLEVDMEGGARAILPFTIGRSDGR
jgi:hypothetical protein